MGYLLFKDLKTGWEKKYSAHRENEKKVVIISKKKFLKLHFQIYFF